MVKRPWIVLVTRSPFIASTYYKGPYRWTWRARLAAWFSRQAHTEYAEVRIIPSTYRVEQGSTVIWPGINRCGGLSPLEIPECGSGALTISE